MIKRLILVLLVIGSYSGQSQSPVDINDAMDHRDFMPSDLSYFVDSTNSISFKSISSGSFHANFKQHSSYQNSDFRENSSYWIKLILRSPNRSEKFWLLEFYDQTIDSLISYVPQNDMLYKKIGLGD